MRILIACEYSGTVRDAFIRAGHDAMSCDLLPTDAPGPHYQGDVMNIIDDGWDMMVAHPPCTYMSCAGACRMYPQKGIVDFERLAKAMEAKNFFMCLLNAPIPRICVENPKPLNILGLPAETQIIQPWMFGEPYTKKTLLWLKNLKLLTRTNVITQGVVPFCPSNTSRKLGGKSLGAAKRGNDSKNRSATFQGIADAMANQWGNV